MTEREVTADATSYVRACEDVEALGVNPIWIPLILASIFFQSTLLTAATVVVIVFLVMAKRNGARPFDLLRRLRRIIAGPKRRPFRGF